MKLAIMQPYMLPYIGYFQLINAVDKFVIYDDVNFIKGGWINRNNILLNNKKHLFTISLGQSSSFKHINEIFIKDNFVKLQKTFHSSYSRAPYFELINKLLKNIFSYNEKQLGKFITNSIKVICAYLEIDTELIISSEIDKNNKLANKDKVIHICELLGANQYINAAGGRELYDKEEFAAHGIELKFLESRGMSYKQFGNEFVPWLSIIDVMMFNPKEKIKEKLNQYELI